MSPIPAQYGGMVLQQPGRLATFGIALLVTAIWGFNFVIIAVGLVGVPPLLLAALRFVLASLPAVFFVKKPQTSFKLIAAYGLILGVGEFGLLFCAMKLGASAGLSSIVLQVQAFFTALLAIPFLKEKMRLNQVFGMILAFAGLGLIAFSAVEKGAAMPLIAFGMLILAALAWAGANLIARQAGPVSALGLMVWSSLFSPIPLFALSWLLEGPAAIGPALANIGWLSIGSIAYLAFISTLIGYGLWNYLIARKGASAIAPFSLLVPIFGVSSAALFLGEHFTLLHFAAAALILGGLAIHALWRRK